jgi:hypothetical protein
VACDISDAEKHGSTPDRHSYLWGHFDRQPLTSTQKGASLIGLEQSPQWASSPDSLHIEML